MEEAIECGKYAVGGGVVAGGGGGGGRAGFKIVPCDE